MVPFIAVIARFAQFIREIVVQLFHAGLDVTLPFFPLTHFGTRRAAVERLKMSVRTVDHLSQISVFEVTLNEIGLVFRDTEDFGSPKPQAIMRECIRGDHQKRYEVSQQIEQVSKLDNIDINEKRRMARVLVHDVIKHTCDVLRYKNQVEDPGQTSYCVLNGRIDTISRIDGRQVSDRSAEIDLGDVIARLTLLAEPKFVFPLPPQFSNLEFLPRLL